jgi:fructose-1,6-bisphosphatase I
METENFNRDIVTLSEFVIRNQKDFPYAKGDLTRLLGDIAVAAKIVTREVRKAGLVNILGEFGTTNTHGESQKKLDVYANDQFIAAMKHGGVVAGVASEENDNVVVFEDRDCAEANYVVCIDPLDGSSNIDVNVSIGTIFSVYRTITKKGVCSMQDFLQPGTEQVAAGYIIYGSSTMLVYTTGHGVNGFTLDPSIGVFCLSHPDLKTPEKGQIYSVNEGNFNYFSPDIQDYIRYCQGTANDFGKSYSCRYIGSLVADFHRNLIKGGIYMYPSTEADPKGKLRLLYECNPLAFIVEQAGGKASTGFERIMEIKPEKLHQRVPYFVGSLKMVEKAEELLAQSATK